MFLWINKKNNDNDVLLSVYCLTMTCIYSIHSGKYLRLGYQGLGMNSCYLIVNHFDYIVNLIRVFSVTESSDSKQ